MIINNESVLSYFIPHPHTHQKAKLLHWHYFIIYILLFMLLQVGINLVNLYKPGVLGIESSITVPQIINDTNIQREKNGLNPLKESKDLDSAAYSKAKDMFAEDYWAHYSPSGKDPWSFILSSGYKFSYAGENLARNFYNSADVVTAWMNSPSHRENILNPHYQDIGIAVVPGTLLGEKTTLVVQMFGTPYSPISAVPQITPVPIHLIAQNKPITVNNNYQGRPLVDPSMVSKMFSLIILGGLGILIILDYLILRKRGVIRISAHHFAQLSLLVLAIVAILVAKVGAII